MLAPDSLRASPLLSPALASSPASLAILDPLSYHPDMVVTTEAYHKFTPEERARGVAAAAKANRAASQSSQKAIALEMQQVARQIALSDKSNGVRVQAIRAVDICAERIRLIEMKPLPGSLKPELAKPAVAQRPRRARDYLADVAAYQAAQAQASDSGQTASQVGAPADPAGESGNPA